MLIQSMRASAYQTDATLPPQSPIKKSAFRGKLITEAARTLFEVRWGYRHFRMQRLPLLFVACDSRLLEPDQSSVEFEPTSFSPWTFPSVPLA